MSYGIFIVDRASSGERIGLWLEGYNLDAFDGRGFATFTSDPEHAVRFPDALTAWKAWRRPSRTRPLREDGKPNRPLTAYTVEIRRPSIKART